MEGRNLKLLSDHHTPLWILHLTGLTPAAARLRLWLLEIDLIITYQAVVNNEEVDAVRRLESNGSDLNNFEEDMQAVSISRSSKQDTTLLGEDEKDCSTAK